MLQEEEVKSDRENRDVTERTAWAHAPAGGGLPHLCAWGTPLLRLVCPPARSAPRAGLGAAGR